MPDIVATVAASNANSFVTLDEFDAWCDTRSYAQDIPTTNSDDVRSRALIDATRDLSLIPYIGVRVVDTQALSWPRQYAINPDKINLTNVIDIAFLYYAPTEIPNRVKEATFEYAFEILRASGDITSEDRSLNIARKTTGPLQTEYTDVQLRRTGLGKYPRIIMNLDPLIDRSGRTNVASGGSGGLTLTRC